MCVRNSVLGLLLLCVMFGAVSCGGSGSSNGGGSTVTPLSGTVTVTGAQRKPKPQRNDPVTIS